jgi:CDP-glycerol glycerophosphotransferase
MENPMPVLKRCDLFILPSLYEGLGLVILEADTLGIPVIATDIPGPRGFMKTYGGTLVPDSREGITQGMKQFRQGKIKPMQVDYERYNREAVNKFYEII